MKYLLTPVTNEQEYDQALTMITELQRLIDQQELQIYEYFNRRKKIDISIASPDQFF